MEDKRHCMTCTCQARLKWSTRHRRIEKDRQDWDMCERIAEAAGLEFGFQPWILRGRRRPQDLAMIRRVCMVLCWEMGVSLTAVGKYFCRDHSTVSYAKDMSEHDPRYEILKKRIKHRLAEMKTEIRTPVFVAVDTEHLSDSLR